MLMALLLPLGAWAEGNIGVQLSTTMTKEFGDADPEFLAVTDFVIISNTTGEVLTEADLENSLKFQRKQDNEGEDRGTYEYEVTVSAAFAELHPDWNVVATNTGILTITEKPLTAEMIGGFTELEGYPFTFKADEWQPKPAVINGETALEENTDFTYSWENNINAGEETAKVIITAVEGGNYSGFAEKTFTIAKKVILADELSIAFENEYTYTGEAIEPELTVKDMSLGTNGTALAATDFSVNYSEDHTNATLVDGDTYLTVSETEAGNYTFGAVQENFTINKAPLTISIPTGQKKVYGEEDPDLIVEYDSFVNEETAAGLAALETPQFVVPTLTREVGDNAGVYAISITNADAVIEGARNYDVTISDATVNFSIQAKDIAEVTITLANQEGDDYTYNGEEHFKDVTVTLGVTALEENIDYTVATTENINAGENTAIVTVTGKNNYKGTKTANFSIAKAEIAIIPEAKEMAYGATEVPDLTYTLKVGDETVDNDVLNGTVNLQREPGSTVGSYKIWFESYEEGETADNYTIVNTDTKATEVENNRYALFTITGSEGTLYLKFKEGTTATKVYGAENPEWSIEDLEVDESVEDGVACEDWDDIKYSFGDPEFEIESENVEDNETNFVSVSNQLTSPIYPTVVVATMPFTITPKDIALAVADQEIAYGAALSQEEFELAEGYVLAPNEIVDVLGVEIKVDDLGTYAPGSVTEGVIYATINNPNYNLVTDDCTRGTLTVTEAGEEAQLYLADDNEDLLDQITAYDGIPVNAWVKISQRDRQLSGARTWAAEKWNTMTLPFDITVAELSQILGYAVVNVIDPDGYSEENGAPVYKFKLTMKGGYGEDVLPANKPFTIKTTDALNAWIAEHGVDGYLDFGPRTIVAPTENDFAGVAAGGGSKFKPAYAEREVTSDDEGNIWFLLGSYTKWAYIKSNSTNTWNIVPFEGFIDQSGNDAQAPEAAIFIMEELDGSTTAIKGVEIDNINGVQNAEGLYNLNGMKLMSVPTQKGVYIQNGKKVIIK